jgi:hyperosmotically inducible protein
MRLHTKLGRSLRVPMLLVGIGFAAFPAAGFAAPKDQTPISDTRIKGNVEHKISDLGSDVSAVTVTVNDQVVTLSGTVPSVWLKQQAIERARKTADVKSVVSDLTVMKEESDEALASQVAKELRRYVFYTVYDDVNGRVRDGVVTLTGEVTPPYKADEMANLVAKVHGVSEVNNDIKALPVSISDDRLRVQIARAIYRDSLFWNYAIQVNPPIHVVVEHGHVTLTGVVNSEVERRKAEVIARTTFGSFSVDNELKLDSEMTGKSS